MPIDTSNAYVLDPSFTKAITVAAVNTAVPLNTAAGIATNQAITITVSGLADTYDVWILVDVDGTTEEAFINDAYQSGYTGTALESGGVYTFSFTRDSGWGYGITVEYALYETGVDAVYSVFYSEANPLYSNNWLPASTIESYISSSISGYTYMSLFSAAVLGACATGTIDAIHKRRLVDLLHSTELGALISTRLRVAEHAVGGSWRATTASTAAIASTIEANKALFNLGLAELVDKGVSSALTNHLETAFNSGSLAHKCAAASLAIQLAVIQANNLT